MKRIFTLLLLLAIAFSIQSQEIFEQYLQLEDEYEAQCLSDSTTIGYRFFYNQDSTFQQVDVFHPSSMCELLRRGITKVVYVDNQITFSQSSYWSYLKTKVQLPEWPLNVIDLRIPRTPTLEGFKKFREEKGGEI